MKQTQKCFVCGVEGLVTESEIRISEADPLGTDPLFVARCPLCKRFICSKHGEKLPSGKHQISLIGCPFDMGIPLGPSINFSVILKKILK